VVALARLTGSAVVPISMAARPALRFRSWDRTILPLPFARVTCCYGAPLGVAPDADEAALESARKALERELDRLAAAAEAELGISSPAASR
jgi:lysophospholipid acyltransferase (LPLAT)-like uncharacterized protein